MEEQEKPRNAFEDFINSNPSSKLSEAIDGLGGESPSDNQITEPEQNQTTTKQPRPISITLEFYLNEITNELVSLIYAKGYSAAITQYRPDRVDNGGAGFFSIFNAPNLEGFVKEYEEQLEYIGVRFHRLDSKKIVESENNIHFEIINGVKLLVKDLYGDFHPMFSEVYGLRDLPILFVYQIPGQIFLDFDFEKENYLQLYLIQL